VIEKKSRRGEKHVSRLGIPDCLLHPRDQRQQQIEDEHCRQNPRNRFEKHSEGDTAENSSRKYASNRVPGRERVGREVPHISVVGCFVEDLLANEGREIRLLEILNPYSGVEPYDSTSRDYAAVHLVVLSANQAFVEEAKAIEHIPSEAPVWNGVYRTFARVGPESRIADAEAMRSYRLDERRLVSGATPNGRHCASGVVCAGSHRRLQGEREVVSRVDGMSVEAKEIIPGRVPYADIECVGLRSIGVVEETNSRVGSSHLAHYIACAIV